MDSFLFLFVVIVLFFLWLDEVPFGLSLDSRLERSLYKSKVKKGKILNVLLNEL